MLLMIIALLVFIVTYLCIITEWVNKMLAALIGGFVIIVLGVVDQTIAFSAIDWNVIFFLIGMMLTISVMRETGMFMYIAIKTAKIAKGSPLKIMALMFMATALISAILGSVTTIMILIPIVLLISEELKITPVPFIITMVVASNMGGAATMIGDPPNILIASATKFTFVDFVLNLTPIILIIVAFSLGLIWLLYRGKMRVSNERRAKIMEYNDKNLITNHKLLWITLSVVGLMLLAFIFQKPLHLENATIAMAAGLILVFVGSRKKVETIILNDIDWITIFFFIGLFMIVEGLVHTGFIDLLAQGVISVTNGEPKTTSMVILWLSGIFSAFVDNIPFVAAMIPMIERIGEVITDPVQIKPLWWALSLGTCLGGNGTLVGASANIVAVGIANRNGYKISFMDYTKIGVLFALESVILSSLYIWIRY
ncbi:MAG TPA: ArsB/NhaD family transporter [Candidatus Cloacimonas sp.]|jgi:Na+/H+ antiporter NhaD/arsenite permease-like protein|nr:ArsB/NhaD family transporter [Candidatus Cloacimonas sp.]MDD2250348.1 ArsB/NhaD family transporter [Candidatus Cloacimonadota bacterium]MCK9157510.1 ArsB/NhaD family transporter [Candidatus Cloacimonas sp.]MCK9165168.1 ArsB/NhaD family transporter [Candidatus Cloacimonas sp.]MDD3733857.1 ArsB/NhaD family transporter [Candidatus Cloacimonadota bacterium]